MPAGGSINLTPSGAHCIPTPTARWDPCTGTFSEHDSETLRFAFWLCQMHNRQVVKDVTEPC